MDSDFDLVMVIGTEAYAGKVDLAGSPYVLHPLRVMARMPTLYTKALAFLHDVIEMSDDAPYVAAEKLVLRGLSKGLVDDLLLLTRMPGESYTQYCRRAGSKESTRTVKVGDIDDNMDLTRLHKVTDKVLARQAKYHKARRRLLEMGPIASPQCP